MEDNRMDSLTSNSKIKNLFLIILLSILFTITAISLQHPTVAHATEINATVNSKQFDSNETDESANDTAGYLYWAASSQRSGIAIYVSDNTGDIKWCKSYYDKSYKIEYSKDYAGLSTSGGYETRAVASAVSTCATKQQDITSYTYLADASTVYYDNGWKSRGSEVADWLVSAKDYNGATTVIRVGGQEYTYQNWMDLIIQDIGGNGFCDIIKPLVESVDSTTQWHVFFEPISVDYLYTDALFETEETDGYGNVYQAGSPIPTRREVDGKWYPITYRCCSKQFLSYINRKINADTGYGQYTYKFYNRQLPYSLCLEQDVVFASTNNNGNETTLYAVSRPLTDGLILTTHDSKWNTSYGFTKEGIGIASIDLSMFKSPLDTYWEPNGSPGDPEPTDDTKTGECIIIKHYYDVKKTYKSDGTTLKTATYTEVATKTEEQTTNYINVDDEASVNGYALKQWATSGSDLAIDVPSPDTEGEIKFHDTSGCIKVDTSPLQNFESEQTYIILILVNEETDQDEDDLDDYFEITESTLTKRVNFSQNKQTASIKDATFKWTRNQFDSKAA
jgi:hypothetical protein